MSDSISYRRVRGHFASLKLSLNLTQRFIFMSVVVITRCFYIETDVPVKIGVNLEETVSIQT